MSSHYSIGRKREHETYFNIYRICMNPLHLLITVSITHDIIIKPTSVHGRLSVPVGRPLHQQQVQPGVELFEFLDIAQELNKRRVAFVLDAHLVLEVEHRVLDGDQLMVLRMCLDVVLGVPHVDLRVLFFCFLVADVLEFQR